MIRAGLIGCGKDVFGGMWLPILNRGSQEVSGQSEMRVVAVWDHDANAAVAAASEYKIEAVDNFSEMATRLDGVIVTDGDLHRYADYVTPFIKAGIPMFLRLPFASDVAMAERILDCARKEEAPLISVSPLYFAQSVAELRRKVQLAQNIQTFIATGSYGCTHESSQDSVDVDGFYTNTARVISILFSVFGGDIDLIQSHAACSMKGTATMEEGAVQAGKENTLVYMRYKDGAQYPGLQGILQLLSTTRYETCRLNVFGQNEILPDTDVIGSVEGIHSAVLKEIESLFKTRHEPVPKKLMLEMIKTIFAIRISYLEKREVYLEELNC